jgi:hypothetical protein
MSNLKPVLGIIGGSGVYEIEGLQNKHWEKVNPLLVNHLMSFYLVNLMDINWYFCQGMVEDILSLLQRLIIEQILML